MNLRMEFSVPEKNYYWDFESIDHFGYISI
jgi:hypothetical protein